MKKIILPEYKIISWNMLYEARHWSIRKEYVDEAHRHVMVALARMAYRMITYPVDILTTAYLVRQIDSDNVCDKILIDGLKGKILKDDSSAFVRTVSSVCYKDDHNHAEIILTKAKDY